MKAFIFDMDGVIINSEPLHYEVDYIILKELGANLGKDELEEFTGMTNPEMLRILKERFGFNQSIEEIIKAQLQRKLAILEKSDIQPIDGIRELILKLKNENVLLAVASSSPRVFIEAVLKKFGIIDKFNKIVCGEEVPNGKPAPDIYLEAAKQLGVEPNECIVLEDAAHGVAAAKAAGMTCIGFENPDSGSQNLSKADKRIGSIRELL